MEILSGGNKNNVKCYDCGSMLGFKPGDVQLERRGPEGPYEFDSRDRYTVECPVCDSTVDVSAKITRRIGEKILRMQRSRWHDEY